MSEIERESMHFVNLKRIDLLQLEMISSRDDFHLLSSILRCFGKHLEVLSDLTRFRGVFEGIWGSYCQFRTVERSRLEHCK